MSYDKSKLLNLGQGIHLAERVLDLVQKRFDKLSAEDIAFGDSTVAEILVEIEEKIENSGLDLSVATEEEVEEALDEVFDGYIPD